MTSTRATRRERGMRGRGAAVALCGQGRAGADREVGCWSMELIRGLRGRGGATLRSLRMAEQTGTWARWWI